MEEACESETGADDLAKSVESAALEMERAWKTCEGMHVRAMEAERQLDCRPTEANAILKYKNSAGYKDYVGREARLIPDRELIDRVAEVVAR